MKKLNLLFSLSLFVFVIAAFLAYFTFINNPHLMAIHFDSLRGIDYFGTRLDVFGILLVALIINFVNTTLAKSLQARENFLALILAVANSVFMVLILVAVLVIALNN